MEILYVAKCSNCIQQNSESVLDFVCAVAGGNCVMLLAGLKH